MLLSKTTADSATAFIPARDPAAGKALSTISSSGSATSDTSLAQNTEATSVTSDRHDVSRKRPFRESHIEDEPVRKKQKTQVDEIKVFEWIVALQRLVKGKTKIDHKVLVG